MIFILMAHHSLYDSNVEWDEFAGVFDTLEGAQNAVDLDRVSWLFTMDSKWVTDDVSAGCGIRRSFYIRTATMNSTVKLPGEVRLMGLK